MQLRQSGFLVGLVSTVLFHWILRLQHGQAEAPTAMLVAVSAIHVLTSGFLGQRVYDRYPRWFLGFLVVAILFPLIMYFASA